MAKSMRIQVIMEPELLVRAKTYAGDHKILHNNDSQLIRTILLKGITDLADMELTIYLMKAQIEKHKQESENILKQMEYTATVNDGLLKENEILKKNLQAKNKKVKK